MDLPTFLNLFILVALITGFIKSLTVLCLVGRGLGLTSFAYTLFSFFLSFLIGLLMIEPVTGYQFSLSKSENSKISVVQEEKLLTFLDANSENSIREKISNIVSKSIAAKEIKSTDTNKTATDTSTVEKLDSKSKEVIKDSNLKSNLTERLLAFLLTEIREAFSLGLLLLLPCVLIDLLASIFVASVGINVSALLLTLPFKLLLFLSLDGWSLLTEKLFYSYVF